MILDPLSLFYFYFIIDKSETVLEELDKRLLHLNMIFAKTYHLMKMIRIAIYHFSRKFFYIVGQIIINYLDVKLVIF